MTDHVAPKSLIAKLADVMKAVERIPKHGHNAFHGYDYATEADIVAAVRQELAARHVMLLPAITGRSREPIGEKGSILTHLEMEFTFYDGESGETLSRKWLGAGTDKEDKGAYKAMTGAAKYFLLKSFLIPTGDDPEVEDEAPIEAAPRKPTKPAPRPQPSKPQPAAAGSLRVRGVKAAKKGTNARGPWTLWIVTLSDQRELKTFDDAIANLATSAQRSNSHIELTAKGDTIETLMPVYSLDDPVPDDPDELVS